MTSSRPICCAALVACAAVAVAVSSQEASAAGSVSCGQTGSSESVLAQSCTGDLVMNGGRLNLAGHTLRGTLYCDAATCEVFSEPRGGAVIGFGVPLSTGIVAGGGATEDAGDLVVEGVTVEGFGTGIAARNVVVTNSRVSGNLWHGVDALESIEAVDVVIRRNGEDGLHARLGGVAIDGSEVTGNGGSGVRALAGVVAVDSTVSSNARDGIENYSKPALVIDSRVRLNGRHGVRSDDSDCDPADVLELRGSAASGNGTGDACAAQPCADLVACSAPLLDNRSTCDRSLEMDALSADENWAACEGDRR